MKSAIAIPVIFIIVASLFVGCAGQQSEAGAGQMQEASLSNSTTEEEPASAPPNTTNLSFGRDVSDVMNTDTELFQRPEFDFSPAMTEDGRPIVYYFYTPYCEACKALRPEIDRLESRYPDVEWLEFDITTQNGTWAYQDFATQLNLSQQERLVPQVLVNGTVITDRFNINRSLEGIIANLSAGQP